jgi:thiol-disulfide isomerase/thioredoxin
MPDLAVKVVLKRSGAALATRLGRSYTIVLDVATVFSIFCVIMSSPYAPHSDILARAMNRLPLVILLVAASAMHVASQSGRRVGTTRPIPSAPIQPPVNPEPEPPPAKTSPGALLFLPESLREREIKKLDDGSFRLADFEGKVLVINIWASWCGPCRLEVPEYEKVRKAYTEREVEFIGLTTEDRRFVERVNRFVSQTRFGFRLGWADRDTARILMNGSGALPQTLVINREGSVVNQWSGYSPGRSGDRLREAIENALKNHAQ